MRPDDMKPGGRYNWRNQPERLTYMGPERYDGDPRRWHQFALVGRPGIVWCEVLDSDLASFEETSPVPAQTPTSTHRPRRLTKAEKKAAKRARTRGVEGQPK